MDEKDRNRRDGRTFGFVSLTRTLWSSIIQMEEGWITFKDFPYQVWYSRFPGLYLLMNKEMYYLIGEYETNKWKLIDYQP